MAVTVLEKVEFKLFSFSLSHSLTGGVINKDGAS